MSFTRFSNSPSIMVSLSGKGFVILIQSGVKSDQFILFQASTPKPESTTPSKRVMAGGVVMEETKAGHGPEAKSGKMVSNIVHWRNYLHVVVVVDFFSLFLQWILFLSLVLYIPVFVNRYLLYLLSIKIFDNSEENLILKRSVLFIKISRERFLQTPAGCWIFYRVHFSLWCEIRFLLLWH